MALRITNDGLQAIDAGNEAAAIPKTRSGLPKLASVIPK
jgi:hypothetical protein